MTSKPRPASVVIVPLVMSMLALANVIIVAMMLATDGLPDPLVVFATRVFGLLTVPLWLFVACGLLVVLASFAGWYVGLRRLQTRPGSLVLSRTINAGVPALIGLVMPSIWWQVGAARTPAGIDSDDSANHVFIAVAAVVLPACIVAWRWWRARNTLGAYQSTGVSAADHLGKIGDSATLRSVTSVTSSLTAALAREVAADIVDALRYHSAYLPPDITYQFRMPNGAFMRVTDELHGDRRTLTTSIRGASRLAYSMRGLIVRPRIRRPEGGWFADGDERSRRRAIGSLANNVQQAFAAQDDEIIEGAVVIDPSMPLTRVERPGT